MPNSCGRKGPRSIGRMLSDGALFGKHKCPRRLRPSPPLPQTNRHPARCTPRRNPKDKSLYSKHLEKAEDSSEPEPSAVRNWQRMVTYNDEPASDQSVSPRPYNPVAGFQDFEDSHTVCLRHASSFLLRIHAGLSGVVEILVAFSPDEVCTALTARAPSTRAPQRSAYRKKIKPLFQLGTEDSANRL
jgi:hypothetical protein